MSARAFTLEEKIEAIEKEVRRARMNYRNAYGTEMHRHWEILNAVLKDLKGRQMYPRANTLGSLQRQIADAVKGKVIGDAHGYREGHLIAIGHTVMGKWPTIEQALECFGDESAE